MSDFELYFGGNVQETTKVEEDADLLIEDIISASINVTADGLSDFTATIPKQTEVRQYLQDFVYLYDARLNEVIWWGTLETWEESETGAETVISGRGPLLDDSQSTVINTFNDTFADDALETTVTNADTEFDFIAQDRDNRVKDDAPTNDGSGTTGTVENQVITPNDSETFTEWEIYVQYNEELTSSTVGVSDTSGGADDSSLITGDATTNYAHGELTTANPTSNPYTYIDIPSTSTEVVYIVAFPSQSTQSYIFTENVDGTYLEAIQTLSEIAGYRVSPKNFDYSEGALDNETASHLAFPIGYSVKSPDWRILDVNRSSDFAGYANEVTVQGEGGFTVTVSNNAEIDAVGKTISKFVRRPDAKDTAQARSIARTLLSDSVQNRGESGSLTTTIPTDQADTLVGADTVIPVWSQSFFDGQSEGTNYLHFNEQDSVVRINNDSWALDEDPERFEMLIFAELNNISNERYLLSEENDPRLLTLNPDGSLTFRDHTDNSTVSTASGVIQNETTHEVALEVSNGDPGRVQIFVDGDTVADENVPLFIATGTDSLYVGNRRRENGDTNPSRIPSGQAAHVTFDKVTYQTNPDLYRNITPGGGGDFEFVTQTETEGTEYSMLSPSQAEYREGIEFADTDGLTSPDATVYDLGTGDYNLSFSFKVPSTGGLSRQPIWRKGDPLNTVEGYMVYLGDNGFLRLSISDGSTHTEYALAELGVDFDYDEWAHFTINLDRDGNVTTFLDGTQVSATDITEWSGVDISNTANVEVAPGDPVGVTFHLDELRAYTRLLTTSEIDTISSLTGNYRDDFLGGIDDIRWATGTNLANYDVRWRLNDENTPDTAVDSISDFDGIIIGAEYGATLAPPSEISYNIVDGVTVDVKFDIAGRVDTELANVRNNVEKSKR